MEKIFDGLEEFGMGAVASSSVLFAKEDAAPKEDTKQANKPPSIEDFIYTKSFNCPVCGLNFPSHVLKESKLHVQNIDFDLRPIYKFIEPLFYDILMCEHCGYSAVKNFFHGHLSSHHIEKIITEISPSFKPFPYPKEPDIDLAIKRYKMALLNAVVKKGRDGEKGYLCMKLTWLYRLKLTDIENEKKFAKLAVEGFSKALAKEIPPIMGLQESTLLYLLAAFSLFLEDFEYSMRILSEMTVSKRVSQRLKNRAADLKETAALSIKEGMFIAPPLRQA